MSETVVPVASVEPNGTLVFYRPIRVGNLEIEPSNGGVLEDGVPYQTGGGPVGTPLCTVYRHVPVLVPGGWVIGSSQLSTSISLASAPRFSFVLTPFGGIPVQPDPVDTVTDFTVTISVSDIANMATFQDGIYASSNLYDGFIALVNINSVTPTGPTTADVEVTVVFSIFMGMTWQWIKPGDCAWFMEFF